MVARFSWFVPIIGERGMVGRSLGMIPRFSINMLPWERYYPVRWVGSKVEQLSLPM